MTPNEVLAEIAGLGLDGVTTHYNVLELIVKLRMPYYQNKCSHWIDYIEGDGGYEDGPRESYRVIKYKNRYYQFFFSYSSYDDDETNYDPDDFIEVKPIEKMVTVYEAV